MSTDANTSATSMSATSTSAPAAGENEAVAELQGEVEQLRQAVWAHATVDQAIGVIVALGRLSPEAAWDVIRNASMHTNTKLRDVAQQIITFATTGDVPKEFRREIKRQMQREQESAARTTAEQ
ncbi:ANTAR domain-containing protein [Streptomyces longisporoflavus]|uniref:ANTAR domain-containing protein n=1 Tax=Streptomyces longisporoflavus TaxID=28044 RepID=A0ABW7QQM9_9ACTN